MTSRAYSRYPSEVRHNGRVYVRIREACVETGYAYETLAWLALTGRVAGVKRNIWYVSVPSVREHAARARVSQKPAVLAWLKAHRDTPWERYKDARREMQRDGVNASVETVRFYMRLLGIVPASRTERIARALADHPEWRALRWAVMRANVERAVSFPVSLALLHGGVERYDAEHGGLERPDPALWMTTEEACARLGLGFPSALRARRRRDGFRWMRGAERRVYYYRAQIEEYALRVATARVRGTGGAA